MIRQPSRPSIGPPIPSDSWISRVAASCTTDHLLAYCIKSNPSIKFLLRAPKPKGWATGKTGTHVSRRAVGVCSTQEQPKPSAPNNMSLDDARALARSLRNRREWEASRGGRSDDEE